VPSLNITLPSQESQTEANMRRWEELLQDPELARFEGRIETDRHGHIIMSPPPAPDHGSLQTEIGHLLRVLMPQGRTISECPISTADGVKAADVAWASPRTMRELGDRLRVCFPKAPEICVEILSPSNRETEISEKMALYFDAGAREVWICGLAGNMEFFTSPDSAPQAASALCPQFPTRVDLH
jgi:Uma2 family endonuclease